VYLFIVSFYSARWQKTIVWQARSVGSCGWGLPLSCLCVGFFHWLQHVYIYTPAPQKVYISIQIGTYCALFVIDQVHIIIKDIVVFLNSQ